MLDANGRLQTPHAAPGRFRGPRGRTATARRGHRFSKARIWTAAAQVALDVEEPGRLHTTAALQRAREEYGKTSAGDDRLEASICAMRRILYRLAHAAGSAHFATTGEQLTVAAAELGISDWGPPPRAGTAEREEYFIRHRSSICDWLTWMRRAGLIAGGGVLDNREIWWRTEITVLGVPKLAPEHLAAAQRRIDGFDARERKASRRRKGGRDLAAVFAAADNVPDAAEKKRLAIAFRASRAHARRISLTGDFGQPVGASLPTGASKKLPTKKRSSTPLRANRKGVRERPRPSSSDKARPLRGRERGTTNSQARPNAPSPDSDALSKVTERREGQNGSPGEAGHGPNVSSDAQIRRLAGIGGFFEPSPSGIADAAQIVASCSAGDPLTPRLLEALHITFAVRRRGADQALNTWGRWARTSGDEITRIVRRYEAHNTYRLPSMPPSGVGALAELFAGHPGWPVTTVDADGTVHQTWQHAERPQTLRYALGALRLLTHEMIRAAELYGNKPRRRRTTDPEDYQPPAKTRIAFRAADPSARSSPMPESDDRRRTRVTEQLLLVDGEDLDRYASLEAAEQALLEHERAGRLSPTISPSPLAQRHANGHPMPAWHQHATEPAWKLHATWQRILDLAAGRVDDTTHELWLQPLEPIALADGTLTLTGPDHIVHWTQNRAAAALTDIAREHNLANTINFLTATDIAAPPPPPLTPPTGRPAGDPGASGRRTVADRYLQRYALEQQRARTSELQAAASERRRRSS